MESFKETLPLNRNAIFLRLRPSETQAIWRDMAPALIKLSQLHQQISPCMAPHADTSYLIADEELTAIPSKSDDT